jgi:hypothetical protein
MFEFWAVFILVMQRPGVSNKALFIEKTKHCRSLQYEILKQRNNMAGGSQVDSKYFTGLSVL